MVARSARGNGTTYWEKQTPAIVRTACVFPSTSSRSPRRPEAGGTIGPSVFPVAPFFGSDDSLASDISSDISFDNSTDQWPDTPRSRSSAPPP